MNIRKFNTLNAFLFAGAMGISTFSFAQDAPPPPPTEESTFTPLIEPGAMALGLNFGLPGVGLDFAYKINQSFSARARFQTLPFELNDFEYTLDGQDLLADVTLNFSQIGIVADYYPFKSSSFKLMAGVSYFINNSFSATIAINDTLYVGEDGSDADDLGDFVFYPDDIGTITIASEWGQIVPYMGLGFGRAVPNKRVGFGIELGAYYIGAPDVNVDATGMLTETSEEEAGLEEGLSEYAWLPQINLRLSVRL
jgi:hypothetical protein